MITKTRQLPWMSTIADEERQQAFMGHPTKETLLLWQRDPCSLLSSLPVLGSSNQMLIKANWLYHILIGARIPFIWCDIHLEESWNAGCNRDSKERGKRKNGGERESEKRERELGMGEGALVVFHEITRDFLISHNS